MAMVHTSLYNLIAVLGIFINLKVADLYYSLILTDINTTDVDTVRTSVGILRTNIEKTVLTSRCFRYIDRVLITFFLLIRVIDTRFRLVDRRCLRLCCVLLTLILILIGLLCISCGWIRAVSFFPRDLF